MFLIPHQSEISCPKIAQEKKQLTVASWQLAHLTTLWFSLPRMNISCWQTLQTTVGSPKTPVGGVEVYGGGASLYAGGGPSTFDPGAGGSANEMMISKA